MQHLQKTLHLLLITCTALFLTACGFHLQGEQKLAAPLHHMYLQSPDPYGHLARDLRQYLKMSNVQLAKLPGEAVTTLTILQDTSSQTLLSVSGTQQTRQYLLRVTVMFEVSDKNGQTIVPPQTLSEARAITIQSNQILGSSNEANLYYQQMRRRLAYAIMSRLASDQITRMIDEATTVVKTKKKS